LFADGNFAGGKAVFECEEVSGVAAGIANHGKDGDVFERDRIEQSPVAFYSGGRDGWAAASIR
jgi:hypothetical protein